MRSLVTFIPRLLCLLCCPLLVAQLAASSAPDTSLGNFISSVRQQAKTLENAPGMREGYKKLLSKNDLPPDSVRYGDFVLARMLFEATRDSGFWNLHWDITNQPPNSDQVWRQWKAQTVVSPTLPTATSECDELSALYAFLMLRVGVHGVGLFWPAPNHTVAVWTVRQPGGAAIRIVVPTTQIFLQPTDMFGTRRFNPWTQKTIYEYTRSDASDSFAFPPPLYKFFLDQISKYAGASDTVLQRIRYLREGVLRRDWTPATAASKALKEKASHPELAKEDQAALETFAEQMKANK